MGGAQRTAGAARAVVVGRKVLRRGAAAGPGGGGGFRSPQAPYAGKLGPHVASCFQMVSAVEKNGAAQAPPVVALAALFARGRQPLF
jgi:hypothetical protein